MLEGAYAKAQIPQLPDAQKLIPQIMQAMRASRSIQIRGDQFPELKVQDLCQMFNQSLEEGGNIVYNRTLKWYIDNFKRLSNANLCQELCQVFTESSFYAPFEAQLGSELQAEIQEYVSGANLAELERLQVSQQVLEEIRSKKSAKIVSAGLVDASKLGASARVKWYLRYLRIKSLKEIFSQGSAEKYARLDFGCLADAIDRGDKGELKKFEREVEIY